MESVRQDYEAISTFSALPSSVVIFLAVGVMGVGIVGLIGFKMQNVKVMRVVCRLTGAKSMTESRWFDRFKYLGLQSQMLQSVIS